MARSNSGWLSWLGLSFVLVAFFYCLLSPAVANRNRRNPSTKCISSMKQIGLSGYVWAQNHDGHFPTNFLSISNELVVPAVLHCPADKQHRLAEDWSSLSAANVSYEIVTPGVHTNATNSAFIRCLVHPHTFYPDLSYQRGTNRHWLGRLPFDDISQTNAATNAPAKQ